MVPRRSTTVLVVDQDPAIRGLLERILHTVDYEVLTASDAVQAIEACAGPAVIDVLITGLDLPGMNGVELGRQLRCARRFLRVLIVNGNVDPELVVGSGFRFLAKPFTPQELLEQIDILLRHTS